MVNMRDRQSIKTIHNGPKMIVGSDFYRLIEKIFEVKEFNMMKQPTFLQSSHNFFSFRENHQLKLTNVSVSANRSFAI